MNKIIILPRLFLAGFLFILIFSACKSQPSVDILSGPVTLKEFLDTTPRSGGLVFIGAAGIRSKRQESIDLALEEAARRVAMFHEVEGEVSLYSNKGGQLFDYRSDTSSSLEFDEGYKKYVEELEFDENSDVFESENTLFVRARYPGRLAVNYSPSVMEAGGKPSWVEDPPASIGEYTVEVGYAGRRGVLRDTVIASYENAVLAIVRKLYAVASGQNAESRGDGFLDNMSTSSHELHAQGSLTGFYVLETWTDPKDKSVWTLAIAKGKA